MSAQGELYKHSPSIFTVVSGSSPKLSLLLPYISGNTKENFYYEINAPTSDNAVDFAMMLKRFSKFSCGFAFLFCQSKGERRKTVVIWLT